jgi:hypothetical protein
MNPITFITWAILITLSVTSASAQPLPGILAGPLTNRANGHIYFLLQPSSWISCREVALQLGGDLVTLNDAAEDEWVFSSFVPHRDGAAGFWIGLTDAASEGVFVWANGDIATFRNWGVDEPNNFSNEDYGCYFTSGAFAGKWNDCGDWHHPLPGIVEIGRPILQVEVASIQLTWNSSTNRRYQIQYATDLSSNSWSNFGLPITGEDARTHILIGTLHQPRAVYRVIEFPR